MIKFRDIEITITEGLQKETDCYVIRANQTAPIPDYPYISYTITQPFSQKGGTYGIYDNGIKAKPVRQVWSFTVQSDNNIECLNLAAKCKNYFDIKGKNFLNDFGIVVQSTGNVINRDNLITIDYEYRNGFDVTFSLMDIIEDEKETINIINLNKGDD